MSPERSPRRVKRSPVELEEERAWVHCYRRVGDPEVAAEVLVQLDTEPEMKRSHMALYLRCKESLRAHKARTQRDKRIGQFVRRLCQSLLIEPAQALRRMLRHGGELAVECLPELGQEPAVSKVRRLTKRAEFARARTAFDQSTPATSPNDGALPASQKSA